jgi:hypothetical protein
MIPAAFSPKLVNGESITYEVNLSRKILKKITRFFDIIAIRNAADNMA